MAPKKKQSEGIALLSLYSDEDDEEMEEIEEEEEEEEENEYREGRVIEDEVEGEDDSKNPGSATSSVNATPRSHDSETLTKPDSMNQSAVESGSFEMDTSAGVLEETDVRLNMFLPPRPKEKCSDELQRKIDKFLALKKVGKSFNAEVRNRKDYRNPDFLLHAVRYQDIDQIGSCFNKDVFDPHGYDHSDFYDELEVDMKRERERKEQENKNQTATPKPSIPIPVPASNTNGPHPVRPATEPLRDNRQNKKSKWDKVEGDLRNHMPSGGQDSLPSAGAHATLMSGTNAGAGYTAFVQQKRREVEEKRLSEKKLERRS